MAKVVSLKLNVDADLVERVRNAAWWTRDTLTEVTRRALVSELAKLERKNGGPFKPRSGQLRTGPRPK